MKFLLQSLFLSLVVIVFVGCERSKYEMGNVSKPKSAEAPEYTVKPDSQSKVQTN